MRTPQERLRDIVKRCSTLIPNTFEQRLNGLMRVAKFENEEENLLGNIARRGWTDRRLMDFIEWIAHETGWPDHVDQPIGEYARDIGAPVYLSNKLNDRQQLLAAAVVNLVNNRLMIAVDTISRKEPGDWVPSDARIDELFGNSVTIFASASHFIHTAQWVEDTGNGPGVT